MTTATRPYTIEDFMALPDPEDGHLELIAGEVVHVPGGSSEHGQLSGTINEWLGAFNRTNRLGRLLSNANFHVLTEPDWAPEPDVAFVAHERFREIFRKGKAFEGAPDLVVEVVSPSNTANKIHDKVSAYFAAGAKRVWVVYPDARAVDVHRSDRTSRTLSEGDTLTSDDASFSVEGFSLPLTDLFA